MTDTYLIGAYGHDGTKTVVIRDLPSYNEALAVYAHLNAWLDRRHEDHGVRELAIRSTDDPFWTTYPPTKLVGFGTAAWFGSREYRRKELGATATYFLKKNEPQVFDWLERDITESVVERGFPKPERYAVEKALKSRVTIGRCRGGCERAWFWPKKHGKVYDQHCPVCGHGLSQTSLAYQRRFNRLDTWPVAVTA